MADWWTLFHSAPLDELVQQALDKNADLRAAQAALASAHEDVLAQRGAYLPSVTANFSATRQRQSGQLAPTPASNALLFNLFTPEVSISYVPDVFGLNRRTVESLQAQEDSVRYQMVATYLTLTSNVVVTAIQQASIDAQLDATRQLIDINSNMLKILRYQLEKGYASGVDVAAQESQLAQVAATLPPLVKQSAQLSDQLAVFAGRFPSDSPRKVHAGQSAAARRTARQPAVGTGGAATGRAAGGGQYACRQRQSRYRARQPLSRIFRSAPTRAARRLP